MSEKKSLFIKGLRDGLPIGLGYVSVSFAFGFMAVKNGCTFLMALLISMTNLTSAGQFAGLTVMVTGGTLIEMALTQFVINLRYSLMAISLSQKVSPSFRGKLRWILGFAITDEIFGVSSASPEEVTPVYFAGLTVLPFLGWTLGTLFGALLGNVLPPIVSNALGVALYGMFVAIVVPVAKEDRKVLCSVGVAAAFSSLIAYTSLSEKISSGFAIILSAVLASVLAALLFPKEEEA